MGSLFLIVSYIFCVVVSGMLGIIMIMSGNLVEGLKGLGIAFLLVAPLIIYLNNSANKSISMTEWYKDQAEKHNLDNNKFEIYGDETQDYFIYKDNFVFVLNNKLKTVRKIKLEDILSVSVQVSTTESNTKRVIALTATYDRNIKVEGINFKIITTSNTFNVYYTPDLFPPNDFEILNINQMLEKSNRCKLILERDIQKLNSLTN